MWGLEYNQESTEISIKETKDTRDKVGATEREERCEQNDLYYQFRGSE